MDTPPFHDPRELEKKIRLLEQRLLDAEQDIRVLNREADRVPVLLDPIKDSAELLRRRIDADIAGQWEEIARQKRDVAAQRDELARQQAELARQRDQIRNILQSRIWRCLVWAGGLLLRVSGRTDGRKTERSPSPSSAPPPQAPPAARVAGAPEAAVTPVSRASASRHTRAGMTIEQWTEVLRQAAGKRAPAGKPRISVITPVWNTELTWLAEAAISVLEQSLEDWEWCIVDDASTQADFHALFPVVEETSRIKIRKLQRKLGISGALNEGLRMASGEYVCFLDHDDMLAPAALAECVEALQENLDAVYTDSDKVDESGIRSEPFHKPDWSPEYFRGVMYVGHLLCVRRDMALDIGGFDSRYDGVQDFEFMLRYSEATQRIGHISQALYHWRAVPGSVAFSAAAKPDQAQLQRAAVEAQLARLHLPAVAEPGPAPHLVRIVPRLLTSEPRVSILIPTRDAPDLLERCLASIFTKTSYSNFEVICIDNETTDARALELMTSYPVARVPYPGHFNFARANNLGARQAAGDVLILLNNDVEVISENWIESMLYYACQRDVGAVGGLLLYAEGDVQHAGVVLGTRGTADHLLRHARADSHGHAGVLECAREVSAVTAACLMVQKEKFERAGGFNEYYHTAYQDVDLCLQLRSLGLRNIFTPRARLFHLESSTRGSYYDFVDRNLLLDRWGEVIAQSDPYYNPNLDLEAGDYRLKRA